MVCPPLSSPLSPIFCLHRAVNSPFSMVSPSDIHMEGCTEMPDQALQTDRKMGCSHQEVTDPTAPILAQRHPLRGKTNNPERPHTSTGVLADISRHLDVLPWAQV